MPDTGPEHVLIVQDMFTWFPAAKIVKSTSSDHVIKALDDIYTNFGTPTTHRTNNELPFNSLQFKEYSDPKGIKQGLLISSPGKPIRDLHEATRESHEDCTL